MISKRILITTTVAVLLAAGTAFAAFRHYHRPAPFDLFGPQVVAQLHFNRLQTRSFDKIRSERKALFTEFHAQHLAMMHAMQTALQSSAPDLQALVKQADASRDRMKAAMRRIQRDELNLYGILTIKQKSIVRAALLKRLVLMEKRQAWWQSHPQQKHSGPGAR